MTGGALRESKRANAFTRPRTSWCCARAGVRASNALAARTRGGDAQLTERRSSRRSAFAQCGPSLALRASHAPRTRPRCGDARQRALATAQRVGFRGRRCLPSSAPAAQRVYEIPSLVWGALPFSARLSSTRGSQNPRSTPSALRANPQPRSASANPSSFAAKGELALGVVEGMNTNAKLAIRKAGLVHKEILTFPLNS